MKKKYIFLLMLSCILLYNIAFAENKKYDNELQTFYKSTQISINDFFKIKNIKVINNVRLSRWIGGDGSLNSSDFESEAKKEEIRKSLTINVDLEFSSGLHGNFRMAKFKNQKDAIIAYRDSGPSTTTLSYLSLFSGEKIKDAHVLSQNDYDDVIRSYLAYEGYTFEIALGRSKPGKYSKVKKEDFDLTDSIILDIKNLIDKSIK